MTTKVTPARTTRARMKSATHRNRPVCFGAAAVDGCGGGCVTVLVGILGCFSFWLVYVVVVYINYVYDMVLALVFIVLCFCLYRFLR